MNRVDRLGDEHKTGAVYVDRDGDEYRWDETQSDWMRTPAPRPEPIRGDTNFLTRYGPYTQKRETGHMINANDWERLAAAAWAVRENAHVLGKTKVGAAVLSAQQQIHVGCNVEHIFRAHDVHAEVNALSSMTAGACGPAVAVVIAASREKFTPCGGCLDWIFELGSPATLVAFQSQPNGPITVLRADELMPHYPC